MTQFLIFSYFFPTIQNRDAKKIMSREHVSSDHTYCFRSSDISCLIASVKCERSKNHFRFFHSLPASLKVKLKKCYFYSEMVGTDKIFSGALGHKNNQLTLAKVKCIWAKVLTIQTTKFQINKFELDCLR